MLIAYAEVVGGGHRDDYLLQGHPCYRGEAWSLIAHGLGSRMETAAGNLWSLAPAVLVCRLGLVTAATLIQPQTTGNK